MAKHSIELALSVLEAEKGNLSADQLQRLTELANAGEGVRSDVTSALSNAEKRELSPEQAERLIGKLKSRYETPANEKLRKAIDFAEVERSLRASPEALFSLHKLEETGGEPQLIGMEGDEFIFEDRSKESPSGRRNLNFDEATAQARAFGADMQRPDSYKAMQETGKFDMQSWSWLETEPKTRDAGYAVHGNHYSGGVRVSEDGAGYRREGRGWRAALRVKKA